MKENNEKLEQSLKLIVKTSFIVFIGIILSKIMGYAYRIIVARSFGPEIYGLYTIALMIIGFVGAFASIGLQEGIIRFIPLYRGKNKIVSHIIKKAKIILLLTGICSGFLLYILSEIIANNVFHNANLIVFLKIFSVLIPISIISNLYLSILRGFEKIGWYSFIFNILQNIIKVSTLVIFVYIGLNGAYSTIYSQFIATATVLVVSYLAVKFSIKELNNYHIPSNIKENKIMQRVYSYSWPIVFASVVYVLFSWVDSFFIGYFIDAEAVGFYNSAVPIAFLLLFVPDLFMQLFLPLITRMYSNKNKILVKEISKQICKWIFMFNLPLFLLMILFPGAIINILFGPEYLAAENSLRLLLIGVFFSSICIVSQNLISMIGKSRLILMNMIIVTIINVILNIILIPKHGINGAAFSMSFSFIILGILFLIEAKSFTSILPFRIKMINIVLASLISLGVLYLLKMYISINLASIIIISIIFFCVYFVLLILLKGLDRNDKKMIILIKEKILGKQIGSSLVKFAD